MLGVTATQDWRDRKRADTRQRIYETAMRLFGEHGFEAVSVGQIAAAAGVSVPTFYAHFGSKEQVVLPVPSGEEIAGFLTLEPSDLPLGERIRRLAPHWFAQFPPEERVELLARWRVVATTPGLRVRAAEYERATAETMIEAFEKAGAPLEPAERVVATVYLTAFTAAFLSWADAAGAISLEDAAAEAFRPLRDL
jgi:AcrR family transcriptional regulator